MVLHKGQEVDLVDLLIDLVQKTHDEVLAGAVLRLVAAHVAEIDLRISRISSMPVSTLQEKAAQRKLLSLERFFQKIPVLRISVPKSQPFWLSKPLQIRTFASLSCLELNRVDLKTVYGLGGLHLQLKRLEFRGNLESIRDLLVESLVRDKIKVNFEVFWKNLEILNCRGNLLEKMEDTFLCLKSIKVLNLSQNMISDLENLQMLHHLEFLDLSYNKLTTALEFWRVVGNVTVLSLAYNKLDSAKGLERIMGLKELDLRHNLIIDPNGVSYLGSLPLLTDLWLDGNPLSGEKGYFPQVYAFFKDNKNKMRLDDRLPTPAECEEIEEVKKFFKPAPKKMITDQREFEELVENGEREFSKVRRKKIVVLLDDYHPAQPEGSATSQQRPLQDYYDDADRPVLRYNVLAESENMRKSSSASALNLAALEDELDLLQKGGEEGTAQHDEFEDVDLAAKAIRIPSRMYKDRSRPGSFTKGSPLKGTPPRSISLPPSVSASLSLSLQASPAPVVPVVPVVAEPEITGLEFQKKVEELKKEGGNAWLSIFREMQVDETQAKLAAPQEQKPPLLDEVARVAPAPAPASTQIDQPQPLQTPEDSQPLQAESENIVGRASEGDNFLDLLKAHQSHLVKEQALASEKETLEKTQDAVPEKGPEEGIQPEDEREEMEDGPPVHVKKKCMMCSFTFFDTKRSSFIRNPKIHCPQCDGGYVVNLEPSHEGDEANPLDDSVESDGPPRNPGMMSKSVSINDFGEEGDPNDARLSTSLEKSGGSDDELDDDHYYAVEDAEAKEKTLSSLINVFKKKNTKGGSRLSIRSTDSQTMLSEHESSDSIVGSFGSKRKLTREAAGDKALGVDSRTRADSLAEDDPSHLIKDAPQWATEKGPAVILHANMILYFDLKLFENANERFVSFLHTTYAKQNPAEGKDLKEKGTFLVLSTHGLYFLGTREKRGKIAGAIVEPEKHFKLAFDPLLFERLYRIDVGLGRQSLTFHFEATSMMYSEEVESYTFFLRDERITTELLDRLAIICSELPPKKLPSPPKSNSSSGFFGTLLGTSGGKKKAKEDGVKANGAKPLASDLDGEEKGDDLQADLDDDDPDATLNPFFKGFGSLPKAVSRAPVSKGDPDFSQQFINYRAKEGLEVLKNSVIVDQDPAADEGVESFLSDYSLVHRISSSVTPDAKVPCSVVTTPTCIYLCSERFMIYPQFFPGVHSPTPRFYRCGMRQIVDVIKVELIPGPFYRTKIVFEDNDAEDAESADLEFQANVWDLIFSTHAGQERFLSILGRHWKDQYHVDLDVEEMPLPE